MTKATVIFPEAQAETLCQRPVGIFSSGPTGEGDPVAVERPAPPGSQQPLPERIRPCGVLTFLAGSAALARGWRRYPRSSAPPSTREMTRIEPPSDLAPALAVRLADGPMPALAALFDLAQAGVVQIEEVPRRWGRKFVVHRQPVAVSLRPHHQALLERRPTRRRA